MHETGFGERLSTYGFSEDEMTGAIERLLTDARLRARLDTVSREIRSRSGVTAAADHIEQVGSEAD